MKAYIVGLKKILGLFTFLPMSFVFKLFMAWILSFRLDFRKADVLYQKKKIEIIIDWLMSKYKNLVPDKFLKNKQEVNIKNLPIWVFWFQGESAMPEVVKLCYHSILLNSNGRKVYLLSKENLFQYVEMPDYILSNLKSGNITYTNFSDILRVCLLNKYGGTWIDATVYVTAPIDNQSSNVFFDSIKINPIENGTISNYRWASFYLFSYPQSPAMECFRNIMFAYWKDGYKKIIDYLFIDYTFELLYRVNDEFKSIIDSIPIANTHLYDLYAVLNKPYSNYKNIKWKDSHFFKLSRKFNKKGMGTVYDEMVKRDAKGTIFVI